jgi:hypothetical protein
MSVNIQSATLALTAAQVKTLGTVPQTIVTNPGVGLYINIIGVTMEYKFVSTPYTVGLTQDYIALVPQAAGIDTVLVTILQTGFIDQTFSTVAGFGSVVNALGSNDNGNALSTYVNQPIQVLASNSPTVGDGLLYVTVKYTIEPAL